MTRPPARLPSLLAQSKAFRSLATEAWSLCALRIFLRLSLRSPLHRLPTLAAFPSTGRTTVFVLRSAYPKGDKPTWNFRQSSRSSVSSKRFERKWSPSSMPSSNHPTTPDKSGHRSSGTMTVKCSSSSCSTRRIGSSASIGRMSEASIRVSSTREKSSNVRFSIMPLVSSPVTNTRAGTRARAGRTSSSPNGYMKRGTLSVSRCSTISSSVRTSRMSA